MIEFIFISVIFGAAIFGAAMGFMICSACVAAKRADDELDDNQRKKP